MNNNVNNTTEKFGANKDETSSSDNQEHRNTEIVNISMTIKRWYSYLCITCWVCLGKIYNRKPSK